MDAADEIWNRATQGGGPGPGDVALAAALSFHGMVMNGGVLHAFEVLTADELTAARDGFAWLALGDVADFLDRTAQTLAAVAGDDDELDALEETTDDEYDELLPDDQALEDAFRRRLADDPGAFAPV